MLRLNRVRESSLQQFSAALPPPGSSTNHTYLPLIPSSLKPHYSSVVGNYGPREVSTMCERKVVSLLLYFRILVPQDQEL